MPCYPQEHSALLCASSRHFGPIEESSLAVKVGARAWPSRAGTAC